MKVERFFFAIFLTLYGLLIEFSEKKLTDFLHRICQYIGSNRTQSAALNII